MQAVAVSPFSANKIASNGGFKYYQIEITKIPFNQNNDYTKF